MKFSQFLKSFLEENSPIGDLARDLVLTKSKATTYHGIKNTLLKHNACDGAFDALERAYDLFKKENNNY